MNVCYGKMCKWEIEKAIFLQNIAVKLGMDVSGYGEIGVNPNSGYTYIWLEDYEFTLYMPISCDLIKSDVWAIYSDPENGEETEMALEDDTTLKDLEDWVKSVKSGEVEE